MPLYIAPVLPSISAHCAPVWHHKEQDPYSPSGQSGKSTPRCQWPSMPPCLANGNSPSVTSFQCYLVTSASQCFTGAHAKRITATLYHTLFGGHWLSPSNRASASSACLVSWGLGQLYFWSCLWHQLSCCISLCPLLAEPMVGKAWAKMQEEVLRNRRNYRPVYSLLVGV